MEGFPGGASGKESTCNEGNTRDKDSIPGLRRSPGVGNGNPFWCSCLEEESGGLQSMGLQRVGQD